jgi:Arc/MetJ-type ribon-helix-helix transcriptional regulator
MTRDVTISANLWGFIQQEVATGSAANEEEVVSRALELYREMKSRHGMLKSEVAQSLAELHRGEVAPLDIVFLKDTLASEFAELLKLD